MANPIRTTVLLLTVATSACGGLNGTAGPLVGPNTTSSPGPSPGEPAQLMPTPEVLGGEARLALTFPDGSEAVVSYPAQLDLAGMGVQPDVTVTWHGKWLMPPIVFRYGGKDERLLDESTDPTVYSAADGPSATLWHSERSPPGYENRNVKRWLVFELPSWAVHTPVPDSVSPERLVQAIRPQENSDGFVVLRTRPPAALSELSGEGGGPALTLGDHEPAEGIVLPDPTGRVIFLNPGGCTDRVHHIGSEFGATCLADGGLYLGVTSFAPSGDMDFIEAVVTGVQAASFRPAS
jgi:hypothetical protein